MKKRILIIAFSDLKHDARVSRQISFLQDDFDLTVAAYQAPPKYTYQFVLLPRLNLNLLRKVKIAFYQLTRQFEKAVELLYGSKTLTETIAKPYSLIIANDIETLSFAFKNKQAKVFFDAHEYAPRHFEDKLIWRIFFQPQNKYLCQQYLKQVACMTTVGSGLANEYAKHYQVQPVVITNAPAFASLAPTPVYPMQIKLVHHGGANPSRQLERLIEMMDYADERFTLDLILITPTNANQATKGYLHTLQELAAKNKRIRILPPVANEKVVESINAYDIGVYLIPPINFNYQNALPNKLFDFIQARLAIATGPIQEIAGITHTYSLGVVAKDFEPQSLAKELNTLSSEQIQLYKNNSNKAAQVLNANSNREAIKKLVHQILSA
ncbi:MAG: hypothetical protein MUF68_01395 [Cyclobacteriaceae bacterium]|jgi:hypothetical protein|nr:hypothetical protein [Cyclobacteriaceae bacterium]